MKPLNVSSRIYDRNDASTKRIVANQGGTSSGKTWSILQLLLQRALQKKVHISIVAITLPHLKKGALRDFIQILNNADIYDQVIHNKTENSFILGECESFIEFFSVDDPGKARGPRRDVLFVNEVNLIPEATFTQLALRTKDQIFVDYNPADENSWVYDNILTRPDCDFIQTTYKDNSFLDPEITKEIERLKDQDENLWKIYGLGERGQLKSLIYPVWDLIDNMPDRSNFDVFYGLDFGYNHPTALVRCYLADSRVLFVEEVLYRSYMTNSEVIDFLKASVQGHDVIYADAAEPQRIMEIQRAGFNCKPADKSVKDGIDRVKRLKITVTKASTNIIKERAGYKYKEDANGNIIDEPVKFRDDCFIGETLIATSKGNCKLKNMKVGDFVLTSNGFKKVVLFHSLGKKIVREYRLQFDTFSITLYCTAEHLIKTQKTWKPIMALQKGEILYLNNISKAKDIDYIRDENTLQGIQHHCIVLFGNFIKAQFQKVLTFITAMKTDITTKLRTWNLSKAESIGENTVLSDILETLNGQRISKQKDKRPQRNGIAPQKETNGTKTMQKIKGLANLLLENQIAMFAENNTLETPNIKSSAQITANQNTGGNHSLTIKNIPVPHVGKYSLPTNIPKQNFAVGHVLQHISIENQSFEDVYDLTIEGEHEYFANGILVHNCMDALRYGVHTHLLRPSGQYSVSVI